MHSDIVLFNLLRFQENMKIFIPLLTKIYPMYLLIGVGYVLGRTKKVNQEMVATALIYFLIPVVLFLAVLSTQMTASKIILPLVVAVFCTLVSQLFRLTSRGKISDSRLGIWSYACGSGNSGYFGIPLTYFLLGPEYVSTTLLAAFGFIIYESTFGFFYIARAHHSVKKSITKLISLPSLWAFGAALALQKAGVTVNGIWLGVYQYSRVIYSVLGMIMLGIALSHLRTFKLNLPLIFRVFSFKFLVWPVVVGALLILDKNHFFDRETAKVLFLLALVPLPANSVAFATKLKTEPEETSLIVVLSTVFALIYIPIVWGLGII